MYAFLISSMRATCPAHFTPLDLITLMILVKRTSYEAPYYAVFSSLPSLPPPPPRSKYSPQHRVLKHPQTMLFPLCESPSFTPQPYRVL
jgi:hypothetical protein